MNSEVRAKLLMGARVREFSRAHPADDPGYIALVARLEDRLARADALAAQQRAGHVAERASTIRRDELRAGIHKRLLRHLIRVGNAAAKEDPDLVGKFRARNPNSSHQEFLVGAKAMLAEGLANKELFVRLGLSATMLDRLAKAVAEFEEVSESGMAGRAGHVGARADLKAVVADLVDAVETLNPFNLVRFENDPELTAAWLSAKEVIGPARSKPNPPTGDGSTPPAGQSASAA